MKFKSLLLGVGIAVAAVGCSSQAAPEAEAPPVVEDVIVEEAVVDTTAGEAAIDEAELQEMLANLQAANVAAEVELDEEAMADFLESDLTATDSSLEYVIEEAGTGAMPEAGDVVQVHYTGKLADGTIFDSSYNYGEPFAFPLGQGMVIPGWDEGLSLLSVGSTAKLIVPPELAYGEFGAGGVIPPNATLYFEVELLDILPGSPEAPLAVSDADFIITDSGLKYHDFEEGDGVSPEAGQIVEVHYTGWLEDGTKFDSSLDRGMPFAFPVGMEYVIPGWDEGVASMKIGGKRQIIIPAELAYGQEGAGEVIPADATLIFEVELLEIQS